MPTLIGVARSMPEIYTFAVPVFAEEVGRKVAQRISDTGTIASFDSIDIEEEFVPLSPRIVVLAGEPALYAFETSSRAVLLGTRRHLGDLLRRLPSSELSSATAETIRRFLHETLPIRDSISTGFALVCGLEPELSSTTQLTVYSSRQYEAPQGDVEEILAGTWQQLLRVERVGRHDNFFELGGHSLHAVSLVAPIEIRLAVRISVTAFFKYPTVKEMARHIESLKATDHTGARAFSDPTERTGSPLPTRLDTDLAPPPSEIIGVIATPPMPETPSRDDVRVIKRHPNRRLYDTVESRHITLADIRRLVMDKVDFVVIDKKSQEDITRSILLQVMAEQEHAGEPLMSQDFLSQLIRSYGGAMQGLVGSHLEQSLKLLSNQQQQMREHMRGIMGNDAYASLSTLIQQDLDRWRSVQDDIYRVMSSGTSTTREDKPQTELPDDSPRRRDG